MVVSHSVLMPLLGRSPQFTIPARAPRNWSLICIQCHESNGAHNTGFSQYGVLAILVRSKRATVTVVPGDQQVFDVGTSALTKRMKDARKTMSNLISPAPMTLVSLP